MRDYKPYIYEFIKQSEGVGLTLFKDNIEKTTFIALAEKICYIVESNIEGSSLDFDFKYVVGDCYYDIFVPIIKSFIDSHNNILEKLEEAIKYGQKITLITEDNGIHIPCHTANRPPIK